jgi:Protein of unknown function (DUF1569)
MEERRELVFDRIEDVMPEVDRLIKGHSTTKEWTLAQILHHLSTSIRLTLAARPLPQDTPPDPDLLRTYEIRRRRFFRSGRFPEGVEVPVEMLLPPLDADEHVQAESLRACIKKLETGDVSFVTHPVLGPMSKSEWIDFHRLHCAHHLSFATEARTG